MKTDELITLLSNQVTRVDRTVVSRRFVQALLLGAAGSLVLMSIVFGVRHDIGIVARTGIFWAKLAFPLATGIGAMLVIDRIGRPGARLGYSWAIVALPFAAVWIAGWLVLDTADSTARWTLVLGHTWRTCPFNILLLSVPTFPAAIWAMRSLAPTRLRLAGAIAGLLASSTATIVYCLHCPEMSPAFWGVWYAAGMLMPALIGAWLGPRLLRW
ncbi:hypothetical protein AWB76_05813 [Caballeronia temeraria]|uniref:Anti-sigma-F factor NrsF n=1 Tax=Caballeronia temeraria TaxID=1777137 RepID=A0A158CPL3_9BURK|nr:DUF1109 domain-containing protein [Caballeronia temeraria]SAK84199.1 hypothetical protein AWB76_05813 [Caballeronia temeraria]